jgi:hypothetical protein
VFKFHGHFVKYKMAKSRHSDAGLGAAFANKVYGETSHIPGIAIAQLDAARQLSSASCRNAVP